MEDAIRKEDLSPHQKSSMTRQLCQAIVAHTATVNESERTHVALLLIENYPFLKGSYGSGIVSTQNY